MRAHHIPTPGEGIPPTALHLHLQCPGIPDCCKDTFRGEVFVMLSISLLFVAVIVLFLLVLAFTAWLKVTEHLHLIKHDHHHEIGHLLYSSKLG